MHNCTVEQVEDALKELNNKKLIEISQNGSQRIIRYLNFDKYQTGLNKRTKSKFELKPTNENTSENFSEVLRNSVLTEQNRTQPNPTELNQTEQNTPVADKNILKSSRVLVSPKDFQPKTDREVAAYEAWKKLEPNNIMAFSTTYLWACQKGLPVDLFYQWVSEIKQDTNIKNEGAIFRTKADNYFKQKIQS